MGDRFSMFEWDEKEQRWQSLHHPFTAPTTEDAEALISNPGAALSRAYDLVLNGIELGGGSIRIHSAKLQRAVFQILGIGQAEAEENLPTCSRHFATAVLLTRCGIWLR